MVYIIPPTSNQTNAENGKFLIIEEIATTDNHPIPIYIAEDTQRGQVIQKILNKVPIMVIVHTVIKRGIPIFFGNAMRQTGV